MEQSNYVKIFKALSNEQRLKIFLTIYEQCSAASGVASIEVKGHEKKSCCPVHGHIEKAFTKLCGCMDLSRSTISHHFKELQQAGLITCERQGQSFICRVNPEAVESIKKFLG